MKDLDLNPWLLNLSFTGDKLGPLQSWALKICASEQEDGAQLSGKRLRLIVARVEGGFSAEERPLWLCPVFC